MAQYYKFGDLVNWAFPKLNIGGAEEEDVDSGAEDLAAWKKRKDIREQLGVPEIAEGYIPPPDPGFGEGQPTEQTIPTHLQREPTSYRPYDDSDYEAGLDTDPIQTEEAENVLSEGQETGFDPAWWQGDQYKYGESPGTIPSQVGTEGSEVFEADLDNASPEEQENAVNKVITDTKDAEGPGDNQPGPNKPTAEVEEAGNAGTPEQKKEAIEAIKSFADEWGISELFDKKELGKAAAMYLGSRLFGYGHEGSANWAMRNYLQNTAAKKNTIQQFIKSNAKNYTPESLQKYKETGDYSVLRSSKAPANATGEFKTVYKNGKPVQIQKFKVGDSYIWSADGGKSGIDNSYQFDAEQVKGSPEWNKRIAADTKSNIDVLKGLQEQFDKIPAKDQYSRATFNTEINPALQGKKTAEWAIKNGVNAAEIGGIMEAAYHEAIQYSQQTKTKVRDLTPFLNQQVIRAQTGNADLFLVDSGDGKKPPVYVDNQKMAVLNKNVLSKYQDKPGKDIDKLNIFWTHAAKKWANLDSDARKTWDRRAGKRTTGFYEYVFNNL